MPVVNLKQRKTEIRSRYKKLRENYDPARKAEADRLIAERLFETDEFREAELILAFVSKDIEVDTSPIISRALGLGKRVALPRCNDDRETMSYYLVTSPDDLEKGCYGIFEPKTDVCMQVGDFSGGLCIVPGLVFDREGYRLGFGKGYYDRFISGFGGITVGLCYSDCVFPEVPRDTYDRAVDMVITEEQVIENKFEV